MGAGKSTIGRLLSEHLATAFVDLDRLIEERAGASIPWIFDIEGEEGFRERETQSLEFILNTPAQIIATGGGCILRPENRQMLATFDLIVYLETSIEQQLERTSKDKNRPLLQTDNPQALLLAMAEIRNPLYQQSARLRVDTNAKPPKLVSHEILNFLDETQNEKLPS
ncbi:shikimate kinase [Reinekea sp.]|uniref:shikimate kinase n=1 Tax=Reinekea sp. TaxID=1970455 RepID=UPI002A820956|nr:shikimate kinase [Reinekea sp.]